MPESIVYTADDGRREHIDRFGTQLGGPLVDASVPSPDLLKRYIDAALQFAAPGPSAGYTTNVRPSRPPEAVTFTLPGPDAPGYDVGGSTAAPSAPTTRRRWRLSRSSSSRSRSRRPVPADGLSRRAAKRAASEQRRRRGWQDPAAQRRHARERADVQAQQVEEARQQQLEHQQQLEQQQRLRQLRQQRLRDERDERAAHRAQERVDAAVAYAERMAVADREADEARSARRSAVRACPYRRL